MTQRLPSGRDVLELFDLDGRVALITGATGLLGRSMAEILASAGAHVIVNARHPDAVEALVEELKAAGFMASAASFDVCDENSIRAEFQAITASHGRLDVLVNNASSGRPGTLAIATAQDFDQLYRVNVVAAFQLIQAATPLLEAAARRNASASVINIASMYGSVSPDPSIYGGSGANSPPYYGAAKAGLIQLTRYLAVHLAHLRIRVNCISPGPFPAPRYLESDADFHEKLKARTPMGRTGDPDELRGPVLFLASGASSYVTGINLAVDGGWTAW